MFQHIKIHHRSFIIALTVGLLVYGLGALTASAANLSLTPSTGSYTAGQTFTVNVQVQPAGDTVNSAQVELSFDPALLSVVSLNDSASAFDFWPVEPAFSNGAGTIELGGGTPQAFTTNSNILAITFRAVAEGTATVEFSSATVLAADGRGTDVFNTATNGTYTIGGASTPTPTPTPEPTPTPTPEPESEDEAIIFGDPPRQPEIGSPIFLDPDVWYNSTEGIFTWTLPFDVNAIAVEISSDPENRPEENEEAIIDPPVEEFSVSSDIIQDGVQYVSINFQNQVGWGAVTNRKLQIDTTPPEPFAINVRTGTTPSSFPLLNFEAFDETSGINYYELTIDSNEPIQITPDQAELGYLLQDLEDGTYTVKVVAYDFAGNMRESSEAVLITAGWIKPVVVEDEGSFWDFFTAVNIFIFFLLLIILLQVIYYWYEHKVMKEREEKLRREVREIQDQMEKIFSALRDEIYDQVLSITKRKRLSQKEKAAVESLTQALEVSETLIEKEINDVRSILK